MLFVIDYENQKYVRLVNNAENVRILFHHEILEKAAKRDENNLSAFLAFRKEYVSKLDWTPFPKGLIALDSAGCDITYII